MKQEDYIRELSLSNPNVVFATNHGRIYDEFVPSLAHRDDLAVYHPREYRGQGAIKLVCSQHPVGTDEYVADPKGWEKKQREYTAEWVAFLKSERMPVKEIDVCSPVDQKVFDALCCQDSIESLRIKWLRCKQINEITKLKNLKKLFLAHASSLEDVSPIALLENLEVLILGETKKIDDYSVLSSLKKLKVFGLCGYQSSVNTVIEVNGLDFISGLPSLEYVDFIDVRLKRRGLK